MKLHRPIALALLLSTAPATAGERVQPPEIAAGKRASLAGALSATVLGPADVSRGGYSLAAPMSVPSDRGTLPVPLFPTYNPDNGISAWGMGFSAGLALTRFHLNGSLEWDFDRGDELSGPFGRLVRGTDGAWYPLGLESPVRVRLTGDTVTAYQPDGSRWIFGGAARVAGPRGTYAWYLTEVVDARGARATVEYEPAGGMLHPRRVRWGGEAGDAYEVELVYEAVPGARFVDHRAGVTQTLDRRVREAVVRARDATTGALAERWRYTLAYDEEALGAAFYLTRIDRTFAGPLQSGPGEAGPSVRLTYHVKGARYAGDRPVEVPQLSQLLRDLRLTEDAIQPQRSALADADSDGNPDLEVAGLGHSMVYQKGSGTTDDPLRFEVAALPAAGPACTGGDGTGCVFQGCRPVALPGQPAPPRLLAQLNPTDDRLYVAHLRYEGLPGNQTAVSFCTRDGVRLSVDRVDGVWDSTTDRTVRLVDLDRDHLPDLVRLGVGSYEILRNKAAAGAAGRRFTEKVTGVLKTPIGARVRPTRAWVSDLDGDGLPDLVGEVSGQLVAWFGLGNLTFAETGVEIRFFDRFGSRTYLQATQELIAADTNKDGLLDWFVTQVGSTSRVTRYYVSQGVRDAAGVPYVRYTEATLGALDRLSRFASAPVVGTLDGTGNAAITFTEGGKVYSVQLEGPETGLLATVDDGMGTRLDFEYARGPAYPGVRQRVALLSRMQVVTSGYDVATYDYRYRAPTMHTAGRFLVGYGDVTRLDGEGSARLEHQMTFANADAYAGVLVASRDVDARVPDVVKVTLRRHDDATFQGIAYKRLAEDRSGYASADGARTATQTTTYDAYDGLCPVRTTTRNAHGTLITDTVLARPAALADHLGCLGTQVTQTGRHDDPALDFRLAEAVDRNEIGQLTRVRTFGADGQPALVTQTVTYDARRRPVRIASPGRGETVVTYDAQGMATRIASPDGVVVSAVRDPRVDAVLSVTTDRGGGAQTRSFRYDGQERLSATWDDASGSTPTNPNTRYTYRYASANVPASVVIDTLADAATGAHRRTIELYTGAEEKISTARLGPGGWVLDGFLARSRAGRSNATFTVASHATGEDIAALDYTALLRGEGGAAPGLLARESATDFGFSSATEHHFHADVQMTSAATLAVEPGALLRTDTTNGGNATRTRLDAAMSATLAFTDAAGTTFSYRHDALGRLRAAILPDGTRHTIAHDAYGRVLRVSRPGVATLENGYRVLDGAPTDFIASQTFSSAPLAGTPAVIRRVAFAFDDLGRKTAETHTDVASGRERVFRYAYDGAQRGLVSRIDGPGYTKRFGYRRDGTLEDSTVEIPGFRSVTTHLGYRPDGAVSERTLTVTDPGGKVLERIERKNEVDAFGRHVRTRLGGAEFATFGYDGLGRLETATFATGDAVRFTFDLLTRAFSGLSARKAGGAWTASSSLRRNDRGLVGEERFANAERDVVRSYRYGAQGFLIGATDVQP